MSDIIKFTCKNCGSETFKTRTETKTLEDFYGAVCANCGTTITEEDVKSQARDVAEKLIRDAFGKSGLK